MSELTTQSVLFPALLSKPAVMSFDQAHSSSDGGGLLLKAVDERLGLITKLADCLRDDRESGKVQHELVEMLQQRIFAIALGHPDCNDARVLADDPIHKMLAGRAPISGASLASQRGGSCVAVGARLGRIGHPSCVLVRLPTVGDISSPYREPWPVFAPTERERDSTGRALSSAWAVAETRGGSLSSETSEAGTTFEWVL